MDTSALIRTALVASYDEAALPTGSHSCCSVWKIFGSANESCKKDFTSKSHLLDVDFVLMEMDVVN